MNLHIFAFIILSCLMMGCSSEYLTIYTDYLSHENLASYHVGTPDPRLNNPPIGQRLLISWSFPKEYLDREDLHLDISIRFRNREVLTQKVAICKSSGTYIYSLLNEDYFEREGILTYKVDLVAKDEIFEEWRHQLWTELLILDTKNGESN
jgi:hypothetical protein